VRSNSVKILPFTFAAVIFAALTSLIGCNAGFQVTSPSSPSGSEKVLESACVDDEVLVVLNEATGQTFLTEIASKHSLVIRRVHNFRFGTLYVMGITDGTSSLEMSRRLKQSPAIKIAEPNGFIYPMEAPYWPNDPLWESDDEGNDPRDGLLDHWCRAKIGADLVWNENTGSGIVIAHLDSGVRFTHEDIADNVWINDDEIPGNGIDDDVNGYIDDWRGWDCIDEDNDPWNPGDTHGTGGAGVEAAVMDNGKGVVGMAPGAKVMVIRCLGPWEDAVQGVDYAVNNGADIINMSFGGDWSDVMKLACDNAWDNGNGINLMASSGNSDAPGIFSPANFPSVTAVGAVTQFNAYNGQIDEHRVSVVVNYLWGTSYGDELEISAYGSWQRSIGGGADDEYGFYNGTSCASPMAAGTMALLMSSIPGQTAQWYRDRLKYTSDDIQDPGFDIETGYGRVNIIRAIYGPDRFTALEDADGFVPLDVPESTIFDSIHDVAGNPYLDDEDLYKITTSVTGALDIVLDIYTWGENLNLRVYNDKDLTNLVGISAYQNHWYLPKERVTLDVNAGEEYFIRVYSAGNGNSSSYILTTRNRNYVDVAGTDLAPLSLPDGGINIPFLKLELSSGLDLTLDRLNISKSGTIPTEQITSVKLYIDSNQSGDFDAEDELAKTVGPLIVNRISLDDLNISISPDSSVTVFIVADVTAGASPETLRFSLESYKDIVISEGYSVLYDRFPISTTLCWVGD